MGMCVVRSKLNIPILSIETFLQLTACLRRTRFKISSYSIVARAFQPHGDSTLESLSRSTVLKLGWI